MSCVKAGADRVAAGPFEDDDAASPLTGCRLESADASLTISLAWAIRLSRSRRLVSIRSLRVESWTLIVERIRSMPNAGVGVVVVGLAEAIAEAARD
jgi:hypothetical protein